MSEHGIETIHILWARSDRFNRPQFVAAWPDGLVDALHEWYLELRDEAIKWYRDELDAEPDGDDGEWTFWMTTERIPRPAKVGEPVEVSDAV